jgi:hypothetical protein
MESVAMKRILLALALLLLPSAALAQCNGVFPNNTACGNVSGAGNLPRPVPLTSFPANAPGGLTGNVQYNAGGGLFGGYTNTQLTVLINPFSSTLSGAVPASGGSSTQLFLNQAGGFTSPTSVLSNATITGATTTFTSAQNNTIVNRSNSGSPMSDVLPGTSPGILPASTVLTVTNTDTTSVLSVKPGTGAAFKTAVASTGFIYICPGQTATFYSDGSNYWATEFPTRCKLGGSTTLFISSSGSASNNGLTSSTALPDTNTAYGLAQSVLDVNFKSLNFSHAAGTYPCVLLNGPLLGANANPTNGSNISFTGDATTPTNVSISTTTCNNAWLMTSGAVGLVNGFSLSNTFGHDFASDESSIALIENINFANNGTGQNLITSTNSAIVYVIGNTTASSNGGTNPNPGCAWIVANNGSIQTFNLSATITMTLTGAFNFNTAFACAQYVSLILINSPITFTTGAVSGHKYTAFLNGVLSTGGLVFPGSTAGITATGGQYQ